MIIHVVIFAIFTKAVYSSTQYYYSLHYFIIFHITFNFQPIPSASLSMPLFVSSPIITLVFSYFSVTLGNVDRYLYSCACQRYVKLQYALFILRYLYIFSCPRRFYPMSCHNYGFKQLIVHSKSHSFTMMFRMCQAEREGWFSSVHWE